MSHKRRKNLNQNVGHNKKSEATRERKREQRKLKALSELAGAIIEDDGEVALGRKEESAPEPKAFDPNSLVNGIIKEHDAGNS